MISLRRLQVSSLLSTPASRPTRFSPGSAGNLTLWLRPTTETDRNIPAVQNLFLLLTRSISSTGSTSPRVTHNSKGIRSPNESWRLGIRKSHVVQASLLSRPGQASTLIPDLNKTPSISHFRSQSSISFSSLSIPSLAPSIASPIRPTVERLQLILFAVRI